MRTLATVLLIALSAPALAQEAARVTEDVVAKRFADSNHPGPTLSAGDEVRVILREGSRARVAKGEKYGWVPASILGEVEATEPSSDLGGFDLEAIKRSLEAVE